LAQLEWANPQKVASIILWHDLAEVRLWDIHWLGAKYVPEKKHIEERIMKDQTGELPMQESILSLVSEYNMLSTIEWKVAKDADILDQAYQCKTYLEQGHSLMATYLGNFADRLHTESAKKMYQEILISNSHEWLLHHERRGYAKN
jgi:5'-deoxynucleotidase YfbR-like HD superfamily hydrolase